MKVGISVAEAQQIVLDACPVLGCETVASVDAQGRVLAAPVISGRTLPPADCSAMDGYAVRVEDLAGASESAPVELSVVYEVAAGGQGERPLAAGEAARIFTGAPIPPGADSVVIQEDTSARGDRVEVPVAPRPGENIREAGEDIRRGDAVLEAGTLLGPAHLGMLASLGRSLVQVHQRPMVAILSGGDELVDPDGDAAGGRIVSSNTYSLAAQCREVGAEPINLGIARDAPEHLERLLRNGLRADFLVSSAGVSVGDHDYVRPVLEKLGCRLLFWGVLMKPGYPLAFGRFEEGDGPLVFGLPGNPVSAMVTFEQFIRPAIRKATGHSAWFRPVVRARLAETLTKKAGRLHFVRVQLAERNGRIEATSTGNQSSGVLRSMSLAHGLMVFPADATEIKADAEVRVQVIDEQFFTSTESGV
jgi:molybdopterin molybdotransferase